MNAQQQRESIYVLCDLARNRRGVYLFHADSADRMLSMYNGLVQEGLLKEVETGRTFTRYEVTEKGKEFAAAQYAKEKADAHKRNTATARALRAAADALERSSTERGDDHQQWPHTMRWVSTGFELGHQRSEYEPHCTAILAENEALRLCDAYDPYEPVMQNVSWGIYVPVATASAEHDDEYQSPGSEPECWNVSLVDAWPASISESAETFGQPAPVQATGDVWAELIDDEVWRGDEYGLAEIFADRREMGIAKYGTPLQRGNGRDSLKDFFEEMLDALAYARQANNEALEEVAYTGLLLAMTSSDPDEEEEE